MKREIEQNDIEKTQAKAIVALLDQDLASIDALTLSKLKYGREKALSSIPVAASANNCLLLSSLALS